MRSGHLSTVVGTALVLTVGMVLGFVGVNDRCALPTPYPPPGAGAGTVHNPGFDEGFTNGVANQWVAFKDASYTGQVHYAGTDRSFSGGSSQKLVLPQPPYNDQEAGIYQQMWVVPGGAYTATVRIYLEPPPQQSYNGEDLVAWVGLDPFGEDKGDGGGMAWSVNVATPNTWITATTTAKAVLPVMTVSLKGTRKWAQHGDSARVWFDNLTISGPIPTGAPPGPEPEPVDPEMLIPRTFGGNLVANPSFEQAFTDGVSAGWNKWSTAGTGNWRQSTRIGKIGGGRYDCGDLNGLAEMNPKTILLYGGTPSATNPNDAGGNGVYGDVNYLAGNCAQLENTIFVGRPAIDGNWDTYKTNPTFYGRQLADQLWIKQQQLPRIDCWQGVNEPDWGDTWQTVLTFEKAFADRAHELGMKTCSLNLSTGSPGNYWRMIDETFSPSCRDLLATADYLGHHCYGGPSDDLMLVNQSRDDACSFAMRPRRFKDMYDRRGWRFPPVIATEGSTYGGWHGNWRPETISNDLTTMGAYMNANRWWCGYTNFVAGGSCGWGGFEIVGQGNITKDVGAWNASNPADAMDGLYSQMFGAGNVHPRTVSELVPAGQFTGGINRQISGLMPGQAYLVLCWMKYEFRGHQPVQLRFHLGVDPTGQTANGAANSIDWGVDQIADKQVVHEGFTHVWRTFVASSSTESIWLRAGQSVADPSFMTYVDNVEVRQLNSGTLQPVLEVSPLQVDVSTSLGVNPPSGSFTVRNASGAGTMTYAITGNAGWLAVNPSGGTSTTQTDTISLVYNAAGLAPGTYQAAITVTASGAANSPQVLLVNLTVNSVKADFDKDGDVDQADFGHLQACLTGPGQLLKNEACRDADLDRDNDVDPDDFTRFVNCVSGNGNLPAAKCAD